MNPFKLSTFIFAFFYFFKHPIKFFPRLKFKLRQISDPYYPALAPGAVKYLDEYLKKYPNCSIGEWGSGRSTVWFAKRTSNHVISIEHDTGWYFNVIKAIEKEKLSHRCEVILATSKTYLTSFGHCSFDVILVDAIFRPECLEVASRKLRKNGLLIVDNSNYPEVKAKLETMTNIKRLRTFKSEAQLTEIWIPYED